MRLRVLLPTILLVSSFVVPVAAHAAIPFFGPVIPPQAVTGVLGSDVCAAGWGMLIWVINNIISLLITLAIVFVAPIMIAYAGFLFVINPVDPSGISKAKGILWNTILGIVLALSGYLIVSAVMAVLYHPSDKNWTTQWSQIITSGDLSKTLCIPLAGSLSQATMNNTSGVSTGALNPPRSGAAGPACDPAVVLAAAATGWPQYPLNNVQANTLACIAKPESNCGAPQDPPNYNWNGAKSLPASTAAGAFQVLLATNHVCYENSACYAAAGVSGTLNCQNAFNTDGTVKDAALASTCVQAASNLNCSASAATCLLQKNGGSFSPWQADVNSAVQTGCITNGG